MLQIAPEKDIVLELINNGDFKYIRALGLMYLRITGSPAEIYSKLEEFYSDFRKLRFREHGGKFVISHVDEFVDLLLREEQVCSVTMPRLPKRRTLEV